MKATELQLGDWVTVNRTDKDTHKVKSETGRVVELDPYYNRVGVAFEDRDFHRHFGTGHTPNTIEPIPLTAEIFINNGFDKNPDNTFSMFHERETDIADGFSVVLHPCDDGWRVFGFHFFVVRYVHELQQLLRLLKILKDIKL